MMGHGSHRLCPNGGKPAPDYEGDESEKYRADQPGFVAREHIIGRPTAGRHDEESDEEKRQQQFDSIRMVDRHRRRGQRKQD